MTPSRAYARDPLPGGGTRFRLPAHDADRVLAAGAAVMTLAVVLAGWVSEVLMSVAIAALAFLLFVAAPLRDVFLRGNVVVTVTPAAAAVRRRRGPVWRTRRVPPSDVRAVVAVVGPDGAPLRLELDTAGRPVRVSTGEPPDLLRRLAADLAATLAAARPAAGPVPVLPVEELIVAGRPRYAARAGTLRHTPGFAAGWLMGMRPRGEPIAAVRRLVAVRDRLVAVVAGGEPWVLAARLAPPEVRDLARALTDLCGRHGGRLPDLEEEREPDGPPAPRPVRPALCRVRVEDGPAGVTFSDWEARGGAPAAALTATAAGGVRVEWVGSTGRPRARDWPPGEVRGAVATVTRTTQGDDEFVRWGLRVVSADGESWAVPHLGAGNSAEVGKECEWLATEVNRVLSGAGS